MFTISIVIAITTAVFSILFGVVLFRNVSKQSEGNKKTIDNVKLVTKEVKKNLNRQNTVLAAISAPVFVLVLYLIDWITALGFLVGVLATILINIVLANVIAKNSGRVADVSRKGLTFGANMALKTSTALALFTCGLALLITAGFYTIFKDTSSLIGLGLGVSLVSFYLKLSGNISKEFKIRLSLLTNLFELIVLSMIITMFLGSSMFKNSDNPTLFPIVLVSASTITFALVSIFTRFFKKTRNFAIVFYRTLAMEVVLFAIATYFIYSWMLKENGINATINFYGLAIISLVVLFLGGYAILVNTYNQIVKSASFVAEKSEMPDDTKNHIAQMGIYEKLSGKILKLYSIKCTAFVSIIIFASYSQTLQKVGSSSIFDLGNYLVLIGLFIGMIAISLYYFQKNKFDFESTNKTILIFVVTVLLPVLIGLTLGPIALGGYLIGIILTGLFASLFHSQSFANIIRVSAVIALLIASSIV